MALASGACGAASMRATFDLEPELIETFLLQGGRWAGLTELPSRGTGFASSPVLMTSVEPLGTGAGVLRVGFVQPLHPGGAARRSVEGRVAQKSPDHVTLVHGSGGQARTLVLARADRRWLEDHCGLLLERRPPAAGLHDHTAWSDRYLGDVFGADESRVHAGAGPSSFQVERAPMPDRHVSFELDILLDPFDSVLASRGISPVEMEDRWFIYLEAGLLAFRRSWTGHLVYEVRARWRGDRLHLGRVVANRDPSQYGETDDREDEARLRSLIDVLLRGAPPGQGR